MFQNLGGAKADLIDKMSYLSKKELAKHNALANRHNFAEYEAMSLKNENEITLKDIVDGAEGEYQSNTGPKETDDEGIDDLYEYWEN